MLKELWNRATASAGKPVLRNTGNAKCAENVTMLEAFEWYSEGQGRHWNLLQQLMPSIKAIGIDNAWIPPACKAGLPDSVGYDIYDHWDVGEFHQKGARRTKWGTKEELMELFATASANAVGIYWDAIFNHKAWADHTEVVRAVKVDPTGILVCIRYLASHAFLMPNRQKKRDFQAGRH